MMNLSENTQKLMRYALEKAHPDTADVRYDERERLQDVELVRALLSKGVKITEHDRKGNEPPVVFALFYCLSCMDDDTYADLMSKQTPSFSRSKLIENFIDRLVTTPGITQENCFDRLVKFELGRLKENDRAKHRFATRTDGLQHQTRLVRPAQSPSLLGANRHLLVPIEPNWRKAHGYRQSWIR